MAHNLFIAYDLNSPGQNYDIVRDQIKALGTWAQIQYSLFYVHTPHAPDDAAALIRSVMDPNDKLAVIASSYANISNYPQSVIDAINLEWNRP